MDKQADTDRRHSIREWVDLDRLQALLAQFSRISGGVPLAVVDHPEGRVLLTTGGEGFDPVRAVAQGQGVPITVQGQEIARLVTGSSASSGNELRNQMLFLADLVALIAEPGREAQMARQQVSRLETRLAGRTADLAAAQKELGNFAYAISHDLSAPLRGIDGWSQALLEDYGDKLDDQARQFIGRVRSETQRLGRMIEGVLQVSRVMGADFRLEPVDLSHLADRLLGALKGAHPDRVWEVQVQPDLRVQGDARLLETALDRMLSNAVKFTARRETARIEFGKTERDGRAVFFIRDNGAGFDMAYAQHLFGLFQRMHRASDFPGLGVGLAVARSVIQRHGGHIWAESTVDQGATFYFTLPDPV